MFSKKLNEALRTLKESVSGTVFTQPEVELVIDGERYLGTITYDCEFEYNTESPEPMTREYPGSPGGIVDIFPVEGTINVDEIVELFGPTGEPMHAPTEDDQEAWGMVFRAAVKAFNPEWPAFIEAATQSAMENENERQYDHADHMYDRMKDSRWD